MVAMSKLSGGYAAQENGLSHTLVLQTSAGVIERAPGVDADTFREKLKQLAAAIVDRKGSLFRSAIGKTCQLSDRPMRREDGWRHGPPPCF
jgi:hypothetical protein